MEEFDISVLTRYQEYDLRNTASIEESVRHSDIVFNLVGRDYPTKLVTVESCYEGIEVDCY